MVRSMTGFGRGEESGEDCSFIVEIRALNHRYLDIVLRLPRELLSLEGKIKHLLQEHLSRGRIEVYVTLKATEGNSKNVVVDEGLALSYYQALQRLQKVLGLAETGLTVQKIATLPDVLSLEKMEMDPDTLAPVLEKALLNAVTELIRQRKTEGSRLGEDIAKRLQHLHEIIDAIQEVCPIVQEEYRLKLQTRLEELHQGKEYDQQRFFTELAFYAERCSIDEEIVRLGSHLQTLSEELQKDAAVGRKMDFLIQEMNREVNTIAAKSNDLKISGLTVEAKSEIEKIREQVQNIE